METTEEFVSYYLNGTSLSPDTSDVTTSGGGPLNLRRAIILSVIAFSVTVSNLLIIIAFATEKRLRVYTNYYIINMAIADAMVGLTAMGLSLTQNLLRYRWPFGHVSCNIILIFTHTSLHVSLLMLVVISIDRWYAIYYPLKHLKQRTRRNAIRRNVVVWTLDFIFWGLFIGVWGFVDTRFHGSTFCGPIYTRFVISTLVATAMYYWFPTGTIAFFYCSIYRKIRSSGSNKLSAKFTVRERGANPLSSVSENSTSGSRTSVSNVSSDASFQPAGGHDGLRDTNRDASYKERVQSTTSSPNDVVATNRTTGNARVATSSTNGGSTSRQRSAGKIKESSLDNKKAQRTLSLLILSLMISWTPYGFMILVTTYCYTVINVASSSQCFPTILLTISLWTSWCNSLLNPIMYAIAQPLFKETILKFLFGKCRG